jgi:uncharacterized membrane protein AbrB (regulator of aidB expression)
MTNDWIFTLLVILFIVVITILYIWYITREKNKNKDFDLPDLGDPGDLT